MNDCFVLINGNQEEECLIKLRMGQGATKQRMFEAADSFYC